MILSLKDHGDSDGCGSFNSIQTVVPNFETHLGVKVNWAIKFGENFNSTIPPGWFVKFPFETIQIGLVGLNPSARNTHMASPLLTPQI